MKDGKLGFVENAFLRLALKKLENNTQMKSILTNWKTSLAGAAMLLPALGAIFGALTDGFQMRDVDVVKANWEGLAAGVALIFARDGNKSSEESGAK